MRGTQQVHENLAQYLRLLKLAKEAEANPPIPTATAAAAFGLTPPEFSRRHNAGEYTLRCERSTTSKTAPKLFFIRDVETEAARHFGQEA